MVIGSPLSLGSIFGETLGLLVFFGVSRQGSGVSFQNPRDGIKRTPSRLDNDCALHRNELLELPEDLLFDGEGDANVIGH